MNATPPATARRTSLQRRIERLEDELARLEDLPDEPVDPEGNAVVWFQKTFGGTTRYTYAAVRIPVQRRWSVTGRSSVPARALAANLTWEELLDFVAQREPVMPAVWVVSEWAQLI